MSKTKAVEFSKEELKTLIEDKNSCVTVHKSFYNLALYPYHLTNIASSIKDILNAGVAKYDKKLDGILLGYKNVTILTSQGAIVTDSCYIHVDIEADFYIFKPEVGATLTGIVNKRSKDHVGCLVHRIFNVSVPNKSEDDAWPGYHVEIGEEVLLQVTYINLDARLPYIRTSFIVTNSKKKKKKSKAIDEVDATFLNNEIQEFKLNIKDFSASVTPPQSPKTKKKKKKSCEKSDNEEVNDAAKITIESSAEVRVGKKRKRKSKDSNESLPNLNITVEEERIHNVVNNTLNASAEIKSHKKNKRKSKDNNNVSENVTIDKESNTIHNLTNDILNSTSDIKSKKKNKRNSKDNNDTAEKLIDSTTEEAINTAARRISGSTIKPESEKKNKRKSKDNNDTAEKPIDSTTEEAINNVARRISGSTIKPESEKKNKRKSKDNNDSAKKLNDSTIVETINNVASGIFSSTIKPESEKKNKRKSKDNNDSAKKLNDSTIVETINNVASGIFSSTIKPESDKKEKRKSKLNTSTNELAVSKAASTKVNGIDTNFEALRNSLLAEQLVSLGQLETPKNSKKRKRKSDDGVTSRETPVINSEEVRKSKKRKTSFSEHLSEDNLELRNSYADTTMDDSFKTPKKSKKNKHQTSFDKPQFSETVMDSIIIAKSHKKRKHSISESDGLIMNKKKRKHSETDVHNESVNEISSSPVKKKRKSKKNKHYDVELDNC